MESPPISHVVLYIERDTIKSEPNRYDPRKRDADRSGAGKHERTHLEHRKRHKTAVLRICKLGTHPKTDLVLLRPRELAVHSMGRERRSLEGQRVQMHVGGWVGGSGSLETP